MEWQKSSYKPRGIRKRISVLATVSFIHNSGAKIYAYVFAPDDLTPSPMKPGLSLEWGYKEKGGTWIHSGLNSTLCWPLELMPELHDLLYRAEFKFRAMSLRKLKRVS